MRFAERAIELLQTESLVRMVDPREVGFCRETWERKLIRIHNALKLMER